MSSPASVCRLCGIPHNRHSYAQRHADGGVPMDVRRELMATGMSPLAWWELGGSTTR